MNILISQVNLDKVIKLIRNYITFCFGSFKSFSSNENTNTNDPKNIQENKNEDEGCPPTVLGFQEVLLEYENNGKICEDNAITVINHAVDKMKKAKPDRPARILLYGKKYSGKTTILNKFSDDYQYKKIWFESNSSQYLMNEYRKIVNKKKLSVLSQDNNSIKEAVKKYFYEQEELLLVFDNSNYHDDFESYLPKKGNIVLLVASNSGKGWNNTHYDKISVPMFLSESKKIEKDLVNNFDNSEEQQNYLNIKIDALLELIYNESNIFNSNYHNKVNIYIDLANKFVVKNQHTKQNIILLSLYQYLISCLNGQDQKNQDTYLNTAIGNCETNDSAIYFLKICKLINKIYPGNSKHIADLAYKELDSLKNKIMALKTKEEELLFRSQFDLMENLINPLSNVYKAYYQVDADTINAKTDKLKEVHDKLAHIDKVEQSYNPICTNDPVNYLLRINNAINYILLSIEISFDSPEVVLKYLYKALYIFENNNIKTPFIILNKILIAIFDFITTGQDHYLDQISEHVNDYPGLRTYTDNIIKNLKQLVSVTHSTTESQDNVDSLSRIDTQRSYNTLDQIYNNGNIKPNLINKNIIFTANIDRMLTMTDDLKRIKEIIEESITPEKTFKQLANENYTWTKIKEICLFSFDLSSDDDSNERAEGKACMKALLERRMKLDKDFYEQAVKTLFPNITVISVAAGEPDLTKLGLKLEFYKFQLFYKDPIITSSTSKPAAEIFIVAPGSQELTSDVDTTISVSGSENLNFEQAIWPKHFGPYKDKDTDLLVQAGVIYYFNQINLTKIGIHSSTSRDTNTYSDGFLNGMFNNTTDIRGYPKFRKYNFSYDIPLKEKDESSLSIKLKKEEIYKLYSEHKMRKQEQELAASLILLRAYYAKIGKHKDDWETFGRQVCDLWDEKYSDVRSESARQVFRERMTRIFNNADSYWMYQKQQLEAELQNSAYTKQDRHVVALNLLYVKHIVKLAECFQKVAIKRQEIEEATLELQNLISSIIEAKKSVANSESFYNEDRTIESRKTAYETAKLNLGRLEKDVVNKRKLIIDSLRDKHTGLAKLITKQLDQQIKTNLFAYEAYTNRSAPYHVVQWRQSKQGADIAKKQVVMGSVIQQIGFRLLHAKELEDENIPVGQILYSICKYGERDADMLFGGTKEELDKEIFDKAFDDVRNGQIFVLARLEGESKHAELKYYHYHINKYDTDLVKIKKSDDELDEKITRADQYLRAIIVRQKLGKPQDYECNPLELKAISENDIKKVLIDNQNHWLDLVKYIIVTTYDSKLRQRDRLWGSGRFHLFEPKEKTNQQSTQNMSNSEQTISSAHGLGKK